MRGNDKSKDTNATKTHKAAPDENSSLSLLQQAVSGISTSLSEDSGAEEAKCLPGASSIPQPIESDKDRDSATVESETLHTYLKTAVFKYLTADEGSSERTALVPVISNLLKFSKEEQDRAIEVAAAQSNENGIVGRAWGWMSPAR